MPLGLKKDVRETHSCELVWYAFFMALDPCEGSPPKKKRRGVRLLEEDDGVVVPCSTSLLAG